MSTQPLLGAQETQPAARARGRRVLAALVTPLLLLAGIVHVAVRGEPTPSDSLGLANLWLSSSPVIDGHVDVPILVRELYGNNLSAFDLDKPTPGHFDIPRAKQGHLGGLFWSIYTDCTESGRDFLDPTDAVRDTLEAVDVAHNVIERYSDTFQLATSADEAFAAIKAGKVASLLGVEGAHSLGNSLSVIRVLHKLGVRYLTLTHSCNNAFADSGGFDQPPPPKWGGLSPLGKELIHELNRLGVLIDLSHVAETTASQALDLTQAPVIFSHSNPRHVNNITRNAPDYILDRIGRGKNKVDGVIMVNFYPAFATDTHPKNATAKTIADNIEYIANRIGRHHVGIGSDFDGVDYVPKGLDDVSKYPVLFAELIDRGWGQNDISLLAGGNLLRVLRGAEQVGDRLRTQTWPSDATYSKRTDLGRREGPV